MDDKLRPRAWQQPMTSPRPDSWDRSDADSPCPATGCTEDESDDEPDDESFDEEHFEPL